VRKATGRAGLRPLCGGFAVAGLTPVCGGRNSPTRLEQALRRPAVAARYDTKVMQRPGGAQRKANMSEDLKLLQRLADCGGMEMEFLELKQDAQRYRWLRA
jgi:hypothetical protein